MLLSFPLKDQRSFCHAKTGEHSLEEQRIDHLNIPKVDISLLNALNNNIFALFDKCPSKTKELYIVKGANHNNILSIAQNKYFENIKRFINNVD